MVWTMYVFLQTREWTSEGFDCLNVWYCGWCWWEEICVCIKLSPKSQNITRECPARTLKIKMLGCMKRPVSSKKQYNMWGFVSDSKNVFLWDGCHLEWKLVESDTVKNQNSAQVQGHALSFSFHGCAVNIYNYNVYLLAHNVLRVSFHCLWRYFRSCVIESQRC